jgi:hypothetical protein
MALISVIPFSMWNFYNGTYPVWQAVRASLLMGLIVVLAIVLLKPIMKSTSKGSVVVTLLVCGLLTPYLNTTVVLMLIGIMGVVALLDRANAYKNISIVTLIMSFSLLSGAAWPALQASIERRQIVTSADAVAAIELAQNPSIIHVVLDGYGASDILSNIYDHDSEPFFTALEERGFVIVRKASVPFSQTLPSMASVLSGGVVDVASRTDPHTLRRDLGATITNGPVANVLEEAGYTLAGNRSGYGHLDQQQGGILSSNPKGLTELEGMLFIRNKNVFAEVHNQTLRTSLEADLFDGIEQPFFYYQHLLAPHPPFSLNADGSSRPVTTSSYADGSHAIRQLQNGRAEYIEGYRQKALFIERALLRQIDSYPSGPKIVLIHGDHGPGAYLDHNSAEGTCMSERLQTFMAFYSNVPGVSFTSLPDADRPISTVNAYREIFNRLGVDELPLLPAKSYYLSWPNPMNAIDVPSESLEAACD